MNDPVSPLQLAPLDLVGLGLVGLLMLLGLWRGLWWQVIRLAGLLAAVALARTFGPELAAWIRQTWPELPPRVGNGAGWIAVFLGSLGVATLLGLLGNRMLEAMQLGLANRVGGGVMGAVTGILVHVAVLVALCQLAPEAFVGEVMAGTYSEQIVDTVGNKWEVVMDGSAAEEVRQLFERERPRTGPDDPTVR